MPEANITLGMDIGPALAKLDQIPSAVKATAGQANAALRLDGTGALKTDIDGVTGALSAHGKETNKLTEFIKTQRQEQRLQGFLFRESRAAVMGLSMAYMALRGSSEDSTASQKKLDSAIMSGIGAFQVADFAIAGLGLASGGTAIAIAGIVAAGSGLISFFKDSGEAAKKAAEEGLKKYADVLSTMQGQDILAISTALEARKKNLQSEIAQLENKIPNLPRGAWNIPDPAALKANLAQQEEDRKHIDIIDEFLDANKKEIATQKELNLVRQESLNAIGKPIIASLKEEISKLEARKNLSKDQNEINQLGLEIDKKKHDLSLIENNLGRIPILKDEVAELEKKRDLSKDQNEINRLGLDIEKKKHELALAELGTAQQRRLEELNKINLERIELGLKPMTREELDYEQNKLFQLRMQNEAIQGNIKLIGQKTAAEKSAQDLKDIQAGEKPKGEYFGDEGSAGAELHTIDLVNAKLKYLNLTEEERNQLLRERQKLQDDVNLKLEPEIKAEKRITDEIKNTLQIARNSVDNLTNAKDQSVRNDLNNEKKNRLSALETEKEKRLEHARTQKQKDAINQEYATKEEQLNNEMDAKYRDEMKTSWAAQKAFSIAQATIDTYEAAAKALTMGPILGPIMAAIVIAAGLADVAAITSTQPQGLAKGTRITKPTLAMIGEGDDNEYVAPEQDFMTAAKDYLIPQTLDLIAKDGINLNGYRSAQAGRSDSAMIQSSAALKLSMSGVEKRLGLVHDAINNQELTAVIDDRRLLWLVQNRERKNKRLKR